MNPSPALSSLERSPRRPRSDTPGTRLRAAGAALLLLPVLAPGGCSGSGGGSGSGFEIGDQKVHLVAVHQGRLADVYGLRTIGSNQVIELHKTDMLVGLDISDQRDSTSTKRDSEVLYDFISANPDTLQPRLLITREIGSDEFTAAVEALDDTVRLVSPNQFGQDPSKAPYSVVARNAALRLTFSGELGITDSFFYEKDPNGKIIGFRNAEAVQLLKINGDPNDNKFQGDFQVVDARIAVRGKEIIVDPVLLGTEGLVYGSRNAASGMPEAPNQQSANMRIAIALEGPLALGSVGADRVGNITGRNNNGAPSVVRDFRSGNTADNSAELSRGFVRDSQNPRLIGQMLMYLERVDSEDAATKLITIYKGGVQHEIDRGDLIRLYADTSGVPVASMEILQDPADDFGKPATQRVRVRVRPVLGPANEDVLEALDPSNLPGFPVSAGPERDKFVRENAPRAVLLAEYTHRRVDPNNPNNTYADDPRNFLTFNPNPLPNEQGILVANERVSPFAGAVVRFSKPIDMSTLIALDTVFFATRNVLDEEAIDDFIRTRDIEPATFDRNKFRTPHLIHSRISDEDGSQTAIRVQPMLGFYLDEAMRKAAEEDAQLPFEQRRYHYFLHLVSGLGGIADLSGNTLDLQAQPISGEPAIDTLVMEFEIDARKLPTTNQPRYEDNKVVYVVRRFASSDEDEKPNYYQPAEVHKKGLERTAESWTSLDLFGPVSYLASGELTSRPGSRSRKVVDDINQLSAPPQSSSLRWCPERTPEVQVVFQSAATVFGQPLQNPLNPYGCRLQTIWREIDMSLSRTDPLDFNLDVEQMYWAPFAGNAITFDEFDQVSLFLGHSEYRAENCIGTGGAFPSMPSSGLKPAFEGNYANNKGVDNAIELQPAKHPAYVDKVLSISAKDAITEVNGVNRFLPLPEFIDASQDPAFNNPYFVWRDELARVQGGVNQLQPGNMTPFPYLLSPFLGGKGSQVTGNPVTFTNGGWDNGINQLLGSSSTENFTGGCTGALALPLLADFWTYPDSPEKPLADPFIASGINGWQVSLAVTSSPNPAFRAYSAGRGGAAAVAIDPTHANWKNAAGGYTPTGGGVPGLDNTVFWIMADFLKRTAVVTAGYVEVLDPHRMPPNGDPRLGPYTAQGMLPDYVYDFEPPLAQLPQGTAVVTEFSGASELDTQARSWPFGLAGNKPTTTNFPLDPLKAGDAWVRHYDERNIPGTSTSRRWWTHLYNRTVTPYTEDPNNLADSGWTNQFSGPFESFDAEKVKYFNWRFIMKNNVEANPAVSPTIESFAVSYRFLPSR